jgi:hypothetical protein
METKELVKQEQELPAIIDQSAFSPQGFDHAQRVAKMLCSSSLIPKDFQGNIQNTMIALEMATRIGASPLMVMQNLYIVHGKPSWSSTFIIGALNSCRKFSPLRFELSGEGDQYGCEAWAYETSTNEKLTGPKVTWEMVKAEGWLAKAGSKWKTMPELMFRYRSAAFFGRLYAPDILMGMHTAEEVIDIQPQVMEPDFTAEELKALYQEKLSLLSKSEMENAKRIIDNNESNSFKKLYTFLSSKNESN